MKKMLFVAFLIGLFSISVQGAPITGYVAGDYNIDAKNWVWKANVEKPILSFLSAGVTLSTYCPDTVVKSGFCLSWVPFRQDYEAYITIRKDNLELRLTDWCNHWLSQSGETPIHDTGDMMISVKYSF